MKSTEELEHIIRHSDNPADLADGDFALPSLSSYLNDLLRNHNLTLQQVIIDCNLERSYGYQLFNGTRRPTRNFLLRFALLLALPEAQAQRLLKIAGRQPLYARNRRDAAVLYGLAHHLTIGETEELLSNLHEEGLA